MHAYTEGDMFEDGALPVEGVLPVEDDAFEDDALPVEDDTFEDGALPVDQEGPARPNLCPCRPYQRSHLVVRLAREALMYASTRRRALRTARKTARIALCGEVTQAFPNEFAARCKLGDRVIWLAQGELPNRASADFFVFPEQVAFVPDTVSVDAAVQFAESCWPCMPLIDRVRTAAPHVLVLGALTDTGFLALKFAKVHGASRIVALCYGDATDERTQLCARAGADAVVFVNQDLATTVQPLELSMTSLVFDASRDNRVFQFLEHRLRPKTCYVRATARSGSGPLCVRQFARSVRLAFRGSAYVEASLQSVMTGAVLESMLNEPTILETLKEQTREQQRAEQEECQEYETTEEEEAEEEDANEEAVARFVEQQLGVRLSQIQIRRENSPL